MPALREKNKLSAPFIVLSKHSGLPAPHAKAQILEGLYGTTGF